MDQLPTTRELRFKQYRKDLHLRLAAVIRSLSWKFTSREFVERIREYANHLQPSTVSGTECLPYISPKGRLSPLRYKINCIFSEVSFVVLAFWDFVHSMNTRKARFIREKIERLEWLRDNWDNLIVSGNLKDGYELVEKKL